MNFKNSTLKKKHFPVIILLSIFCILCISSLIWKSNTFDEAAHLGSGYAILKEKKLDIGMNNPPLLKIIAALPLLLLDINYPKQNTYEEIQEDPYTWDISGDFHFGYKLLYNQGNNAQLILFTGRIICVALGAMLGLIIFIFSKKIYGYKAGLFSLFLFSFSPTMIAHSRLVCSDVPGSLGIVVAIYLLFRYYNKKSILRLLTLPVILAASFLTKFNAIILFPIFFLYMLYKDKKKGVPKSIIIFLITLLLINAFYFFDGTFSVKQIKYNILIQLFHNEILSHIAHLLYSYLPLPSYLLKCLAFFVAKSFMLGHSTYLLGMYSTSGWWYYFPLTFLFKTPLLTLVGFVGIIYYFLKKRALYFGEGLLVITFTLYALLAISAKINIGHRHILVLYPIIFILAGRLYIELNNNISKKKMVISSLALLYIFSTQLYYPNYIAYFNCLLPPGKAYKVFSGSNIDWGQDLPLLKKFLKENGDPPLILSYFGTASRKYYDIQHMPLLTVGLGKEKNDLIYPVSTKKEFLAVSVTNLTGINYENHNIFSWLKTMRPIKKIGYSIYIYDISKDVIATANIAEIYASLKMFKHARRQYRRVKYLSSNTEAISWADGKLKDLPE